MTDILAFILSALQITLLDIALSGDNVGVIALAIRNLEPKHAKIASMLGVTGAIGLRILFASIVTFILKIEWLPIKLVGGILLLKITWDLVMQKEEEHEVHGVKSSASFGRAVASIIIADVSMSLDNVLAIAGVANGHIGLIVLGIAFNIPILFFGSQFVASLMQKYKIVVYIGGAILMHTSAAMILSDRLIAGYVSAHIASIIAWALGVATVLYGVYKVREEKREAAYEKKKTKTRKKAEHYS
jgi:YjbE family integral membrane protein